MIEYSELIRVGLFILSGIAGGMYGYWRQWSWTDKITPLWDYMFGDWHAFGRAFTTLLAMCAGAGGLDYLDTMTTQQIVVAGLGIGILVPQTVRSKLNA